MLDTLVGGWPRYFMGASFEVIGNVSDDFCRPTTPPPPTPSRFRLTSPPKPGFRSFRLTGTNTRVQIRNRAGVGGGGVVGRQKSPETLPMTPQEAPIKYFGHPPTYLLRKWIRTPTHFEKTKKIICPRKSHHMMSGSELRFPFRVMLQWAHWKVP